MVGKVVSVVAIAVLLLIAWNPPGTLYQIFVLKLELLAQIAPAFILGLYWRTMSAVPALGGVVVGAAVAGSLAFVSYESPTGVPNGLIGLGLNLAICVVGSLLMPDRDAPELRPRQRARVEVT
jgi:Na+/proline symporter